MNAQTQHTTDLTKLPADVQALIAKLQAQASKPKTIALKVTAKKADGSGTDGAVSMYGLGRFPITLYKGQWERLIDAVPQLQEFMRVNAALLSVKP
jgi:hypothetical protein